MAPYCGMLENSDPAFGCVAGKKNRLQTNFLIKTPPHIGVEEVIQPGDCEGESPRNYF